MMNTLPHLLLCLGAAAIITTLIVVFIWSVTSDNDVTAEEIEDVIQITRDFPSFKEGVDKMLSKTGKLTRKDYDEIKTIAKSNRLGVKYGELCRHLHYEGDAQ